MTGNKPHQPFSLYFLSLFLLPLIALIVLIKVVRIVFIHPDDSLDKLFSSFIAPFITETNTSIMVFFTTLGNYEIVLTGNILLFLFLSLVKKDHWLAIKLALIALGALLLMYTLKDFFARPRPLIPLVYAAKGFSFPSGHSLNSVVFYGLLVYVSSLYIKNLLLKWVVNIILICTIILIGFSRIYINVHYVTDVLAGFSIGIIWLFSCLGLMTYLNRKGLFK